MGPYELHDFFLYGLVRLGAGPRKILFLAEHAFAGRYDAGDALRAWLRVFVDRFFDNQFKRSAMPDGPKVGSVSLSPRGRLADAERRQQGGLAARALRSSACSSP